MPEWEISMHWDMPNCWHIYKYCNVHRLHMLNSVASERIFLSLFFFSRFYCCSAFVNRFPLDVVNMWYHFASASIVLNTDFKYCIQIYLVFSTGVVFSVQMSHSYRHTAEVLFQNITILFGVFFFTIKVSVCMVISSKERKNAAWLISALRWPCPFII